MERSSTEYEGVVGQPDPVSAPGQYDLAILGRPPGEREPSVHPEGVTRPTGPVTTASVLRLLEAQQYRCALTGRPLAPDTASLDHILPIRSGGEHVISNAQVLHKNVNRAKTTMTNEEFVQLCREVVEHTSEPLAPDRQTACPDHSPNSAPASGSIEWYAEGQGRVVEVDGMRVTIRYVCRKGRRARIAIEAPAGAVFRCATGYRG